MRWKKEQPQRWNDTVPAARRGSDKIVERIEAPRAKAAISAAAEGEAIVQRKKEEEDVKPLAHASLDEVVLARLREWMTRKAVEVLTGKEEDEVEERAPAQPSSEYEKRVGDFMKGDRPQEKKLPPEEQVITHAHVD